MPELKEIECFVYGTVQGVGFRHFAFEKAQELNLVGFVENTLDARVRVVAQSISESSLRKFIEILSAGPITAEVEGMDVNWNKVIKEKYSVFQIK